MNYSKGKWKVREHGATYEIYIETPTRPKAKEYQIAEGIYNKANAQLLVSAPELYEALKEIKLRWQVLDGDISFPHLEEAMLKALAKAEGEEERHNG